MLSSFARHKIACSYRSGPQSTSEFARISVLPRRDWRETPREILDVVERELRAERGTMRLWPIQAAALAEIALYRGAFLPIAVGEGKALISLLAASALGAERPLLLVPASLRTQTTSLVLPMMSQHWKIVMPRILGYSELSLAKNATILDEINPDLIVLDECHRVKDPKAGRTKRLMRWFRAHPETRCVAMSGTITTRSLRDYWHIILWCLGAGAPLPRRWNEMSAWADALDEGVPEYQRLSPGVLAKLCNDGENPRQGYRRRLVETPGVVASSESALGTSLVIRGRTLTIDQKMAQIIDRVRATWELPCGDIITEAVELWRHIRELALGFFYVWDPPAPRPWLDARRAWKSYVRATISGNRRGLDTELQVWRECEASARAGSLASSNPWNAWRTVKDEFRPSSKAVWVDLSALRWIGEWMETNKGGIVWVEHREVGAVLGEVVPYFGAGNDGILTTTEPLIVASIAAHAEGKNLQRYSRNLVTSPPASGKTWEQLLGRTHRSGQTAEEVSVDVLLHLPELCLSFGKALADARYLEDTIGARQKLNYADYCDYAGLADLTS